MAPQRDPGREFDLRMAGYLWQMRQAWTSRRGFLRLAAGSAGAAALMAALGGPSEAAKRQIQPGLFILEQDANQVVYGLQGDVRGLEPALSYDFTANPVACNISEGLMKFTPEGDIEPLIAEKFEQTDEVTYVYTLRDGVVFSDGTPVTMDDVIASIARVRDPEVAGPLAWMYDVPKAEVHQDRRQDADDQARHPERVVPLRHRHDRRPRHPQGGDREVRSRSPAQSGRHRSIQVRQMGCRQRDRTREEHELLAEGEALLTTDSSSRSSTEGTTRVTGLKSGELNILGDVPPDQIENVLGFDNVDMQDVVGYTINLMALRTDKPPFNDVNIRKAISYATDLATIMEKIVGVIGVQSHNTAVPPNMPGSAADELKPIPYDVAKAKELMAASSMPDGFSTKLNVIAPNDIWVPQSIAIQEALKELNIDVEIVQYTYADFITLQQAGDYEGIMNFQWGSDFPDAAGNLIPLFLSTNTPPQNNHFYYNNPDVDKLLNDSESELDQEKRLEMLKEVQRKISDDQPAIFLEHFKWFMPMTTNITGYTLAPLWYWDSIGRDLMPATS